jgi:hypothetical protein
MKELIVTCVPELRSDTPLAEAGHLLDTHCHAHALDLINWPAFAFRPGVVFRIGYGDDSLVLKFTVADDIVRARVRSINGPVCQDSCVEFFFSPRGDGFYYNFEFNCIGTARAERGRGRAQRRLLDPALVAGIERLPSLSAVPFLEEHEPCSWDLTLRLSLALFAADGLDGFTGLRARGNFYKCGDKTARPHYLTWAPVATVRPDFHSSAFFGLLSFQ